MRRIIIGLGCSYLFCGFLHAENLGVIGHTFPIHEESLLTVILKRLEEAEKSGKLDVMNKEFASKAKDSAQHPRPVENLARATMPRTRIHDPSLHVKDDVVDHEGRLIAKAGTIINPLDTLSWGEPLLFLDGRDDEQVAWGLRQVGKITLTGGAPLQLEERVGRPIYFDQGGTITRRFDIRALPARVSQAGNRLKVEEIVLETEKTGRN